MDTYIIDTLSNYWKEFLKLIPGLLLSAVIIIIFYFLGKKISSLTKRRLIFKTNDLLLSSFLSKILKWVFVIFGFLIATKILGLTYLAGGVLTGAGISAIILGFAFKNIGENFISGLLLAFNRPFKTGDLIVTSGYTGTITSMDFRTTNIKTAEGQNVYIPNSYIINNPLTNYSKDAVRRFDFSFQLDYNTDIDKLKSIISKSILNIKEVLKEPAPIITIDQLTSNVIMKIYFWIDSAKTERTILEVKSEAIETCKKDLTQAEITFSDVTLLKITNDVIPIKINS